jgi:hypothetical protein
VDAVGDEQPDAAPAKLDQALVVGELAVRRGRIELEVPRHDDEPAGRRDRKPNRVGDAVADPEGFEGKASGLQAGLLIWIEPVEVDLLG